MTTTLFSPTSTSRLAVALLGGTGRVGGWVLEEALEKGYTVRVLARTPSRLSALTEKYPDTLDVVEGSSTVEANVCGGTC